jgi:predicted transcriptional regulator
MATPTKTIRLRPKLRAEIDRIARRTRRSFSEVAQALLEEAVRMRECPGIYFADEPAGRVAKVAGTGLGVWEVIRDYKAVKGNAKKLRRRLLHLSTAQLKAATVYYARFPREIDAEIADDTAAHAEGRAMQQAIARRA